MSALVSPDAIERIVGAKRHPAAHLGRAVSDEQTVYVLHSQQCKDSGIDLRACDYSTALDSGIAGVREWDGQQDRVVTLQVAHGFLLPDNDGPDDVVELERFENKPLTPGQFRETLTLASNGVMVTELGEDGELFLAYGYVSDAELLAAIRSAYGVDWCETIEEFREQGQITQGWTVATPHQTGCTGLYAEDEPDGGPCTCDEYGWWLGDILSDVAEANAKRPGAIAVTEWRA